METPKFVRGDVVKFVGDQLYRVDSEDPESDECESVPFTGRVAYVIGNSTPGSFECNFHYDEPRFGCGLNFWSGFEGVEKLGTLLNIDAIESGDEDKWHVRLGA